MAGGCGKVKRRLPRDARSLGLRDRPGRIAHPRRAGGAFRGPGPLKGPYPCILTGYPRWRRLETAAAFLVIADGTHETAAGSSREGGLGRSVRPRYLLSPARASDSDNDHLEDTTASELRSWRHRRAGILRAARRRRRLDDHRQVDPRDSGAAIRGYVRVSYSRTEIVENAAAVEHELVREAMRVAGVPAVSTSSRSPTFLAWLRPRLV